jgi:hypothetical protein
MSSRMVIIYSRQLFFGRELCWSIDCMISTPVLTVSKHGEPQVQGDKMKRRKIKYIKCHKSIGGPIIQAKRVTSEQ